MPLPQVEMIPTGGVSLATAKEFLEAGSFALGVGADLVDTKGDGSKGSRRRLRRAREEVSGDYCGKEFRKGK